MSAPATVLLFATEHWPNAARLAMRLAASACVVHVLAPRGHAVDAVRCVDRRYRYRHLRGAADLQHALAASAARLVLPCDDHAAERLADLHARLAAARGAGESPGAIEQLIARSLGVPASVLLVGRQQPFRALAQQQGVPMPAAVEIADPAALRAWLVRHGLPAVFKQDGTWGGLGVIVVHGEAEAMQAFAQLRRRPEGWQALRRSLLDRDPRPLLDWLAVVCGRARPAISVQSYVAGAPANVTIAAAQGRVLATTSVIASQTLHATGPATVIRLDRLPAAEDIAARLIAALGVSGLWGFDFILDQDDGRAWLLEVNPRATPASALGVEGPHRLCEAIASEAGAKPPSTPPPRHQQVALFPREWERDPTSRALRDAYHDVPWEEPDLVRACLQPAFPQRGWLARLAARLPRRSATAAASRRLPDTPAILRSKLPDPSPIDTPRSMS